MREKGFAPLFLVILLLVLLSGIGFVYFQKPSLLFPKAPVNTSIPNPNETAPHMWGTSMLPTLKEGDILKINSDFDKSELKRGDLVVYKDDPNSDTINGPKRIIALGEDTLKVVNGIVYLNGGELKEDYLLEQTSTTPAKYLPENTDIIIPNGTVFLMGDNRQHSADSRLSGPLSVDKIVGLVEI